MVYARNAWEHEPLLATNTKKKMACIFIDSCSVWVCMFERKKDDTLY